jgi:cytochrome c
MCNWIESSLRLALPLLCLAGAAVADRAPMPLELGRPVTPAQIEAWDIDVGPDGRGLPPGGGTAEQGEPIFLAKCAGCHGEFGEGVGRYPPLVGDGSPLTAERPRKTVGNYWPYATTLWDYINRAMPFGNAQSLSADEVYALVAYILSMNDLIDEDQEMNAQTLPRVEMPNRRGFITATGTDLHASACMRDCIAPPRISSRAGSASPASDGE